MIRRGAVIAVAAGFSPYALAAAPDYEKVCEKSEMTAGAKFWGAFFAANPVSIPLSGFSPAPGPAAACTPGGATPPGGALRKFTSFDDAVATCGFPTAMKIAFSMSQDDFDAICPEGNKITQCGQIAGARLSLATFFGETASEADMVPRTGINAYGYRAILRISMSEVFYDGDTKLGRIWTALNAQPGDFEVQCLKAEPKPFSVQFPKGLRIGKDGEAIAVSAQSERPKEFTGAEIALNFDRQGRTQVGTTPSGDPIERYKDVVSVNGAIGMEIVKQPSSASTLYASLRYKESVKPTEEQDDLRFGVYTVFDSFFGLDRTFGYPELDLGWITDSEERDSAQWFAAGRLPITSLDSVFVAPESPILWEIVAVGDYSHVIDEGDKIKLANVGEMFRVGYDIYWSLDRPLIEISSWRPTLSGSYKFRDTTDEGPGNADRIEVKLGIIDAKDSGVGVSFDYVRGEDLTSLDEEENYKLVLNVRN